MSVGEAIVVAMSGGVDSSASALLLHEQGYRVIGISMQVWDYRRHGGNAARATCCAPSDFEDARQIADACGFPYYVFDFEESFYQAVISPFVKSYVSGQTPNPCLNCNRHVKFRQLRQRARVLGANKVATGHFAQIRQLAGGELGLFTSVDEMKDQTYFLYSLTQSDLAQTLFPVGDKTKAQVRAYLAERGFSLAQKPESQDICFVGSSVAEFVERELGVQPGGKIVNSQGQELGQHAGIHHYTIGQRKGLGLSSANPLYVLNIDSQSREVTVGEQSELERSSFIVGDVNWVSGVPTAPFTAQIKLRYRHQGVTCRIKPFTRRRSRVLGTADDSSASAAEEFCFEAEFVDAWSVVSPGQAAVIYSADSTNNDGLVQVLGGGIIEG